MNGGSGKTEFIGFNRIVSSPDLKNKTESVDLIIVARKRDGLTDVEISRKATEAAAELEKARKIREEAGKTTRKPTVIPNPNVVPTTTGPKNPDGDGSGSKDR